MTKYQFIGEGKGVPGLPHELTEVEAQELGVETLLADALANGLYEVIQEKSTADYWRQETSSASKPRRSTRASTTRANTAPLRTSKK